MRSTSERQVIMLKIKRVLVDPPIPEIVIVTAAIMTIVDTTVSLYDRFAAIEPRRSRELLQNLLHQVGDQLGYLLEDLNLIEQIASNENISPSREFRLGREAFVTVREFSRWKSASTILWLD
jgi:hypothetical protein